MEPRTIFDLDLLKIAWWYKWCSVLALVMVGYLILSIVLAAQSAAVSPYLGLIFWGGYFVFVVLCVVGAVGMNRACGGGVFESVLHGVGALFFSWLMVISVVSSAGTILRLAGARVSFLGLHAEEIDKLRPGHCRGCGYDREGLELLQGCPECQRVPRVI